MSTSTEIEYEVIPMHRLPQGCRLAAMLARAEAFAEKMGPPRANLNHLETELSKVEAFLASATVESTTPEEFSIESARKTLLEQSIVVADRKAKDAKTAWEIYWNTFEGAYQSYKKRVLQLAANRDEDGYSLTPWRDRWGNLLEPDGSLCLGKPSARDRLIADVESAIGVRQ